MIDVIVGFSYIIDGECCCMCPFDMGIECADNIKCEKFIFNLIPIKETIKEKSDLFTSLDGLDGELSKLNRTVLSTSLHFKTAVKNVKSFTGKVDALRKIRS